MMNRLVTYFVQGLAYLAPIAFTLYVFYAVFRFVDELLGIPIPGLGFAIVVATVTLLGFLASNFITRRLLASVEGLLDRLPLAKLLHSSTKDLMNAFVGEKRRFDKPCRVDLIPGSGVEVLGFLTRESLQALQLGDRVAVYVPQAYNVGGQLLFLPRERVHALEDVDSAHVMTFIVSGGVTGLGR
jgi:uncharacterized membrane protein